jgi:ribosomal protein S12 methylthiotransferase
VKEDRRARFMQVQAGISGRRLARKVGTLQRVLVDTVDGDRAVARSAGDAPEIDGVVHLTGARGTAPGDFLDVRITRADDHDLHGRAMKAVARSAGAVV